MGDKKKFYRGLGRKQIEIEKDATDNGTQWGVGGGWMKGCKDIWKVRCEETEYVFGRYLWRHRMAVRDAYIRGAVVGGSGAILGCIIALHI